MLDKLDKFSKWLTHDAWYVSGKSSAQVIGEATKTTANNAGGAIAGISHGIATITTLGLASAVSAALTQLEYRREKKEIKELYKEELAAQLHKPERKLSPDDLGTLAKGDAARGVASSRVIGEALNKSRRSRNLGVVVSVLATLSSLTLAHALFPPEVAVNILAPILTGLLTYNAVKRPLHWLGSKMLGLDRETAHDRIAGIKRDREAGKEITIEQAFGVVVAANPELDGMISASYGKNYDRLHLTEKREMAEMIGQLIGLDRLTAGINSGQINATELAFASEGRVSGVLPKPPEKEERPGVIRVIAAKCRRALQHFRAHPGQAQEENVIAACVPEATLEVEHEAPKRGFTERLGLTRADTSLGYVERLEQSRGAEAAITQR